MTTKEEFIQYLTSATTYGRKYAGATIYTYGQSIELISTDISNHVEPNFKSLFNITDTNILKSYFQRLYSVPTIIAEEKIQRNRKTNAFKRYIEFCEIIEKNIFKVSQTELKDIFESKTEGGRKIVISKIAERNSSLRFSAIKIHGATCFGCEFNFGETYGTYGKGFIEIHHIKLLSDFIESQFVNPYTDLIPLCSNCHRMVHRNKNYVLSLPELKKILRDNQN